MRNKSTKVKSLQFLFFLGLVLSFGGISICYFTGAILAPFILLIGGLAISANSLIEIGRQEVEEEIEALRIPLAKAFTSFIKETADGLAKQELKDEELIEATLWAAEKAFPDVKVEHAPIARYMFDVDDYVRFVNITYTIHGKSYHYSYRVRSTDRV